MVAWGASLLSACLGSSVCLSPFLPALLSPSFDKHFLATKSVPGLRSTPALEMLLTAKLASAASQGELRVQGGLRPRRDSHWWESGCG